MQELIKIETRKNKETVNARDLWEFLGNKARFSDWIKGRIKNIILSTVLISRIINL